MPRETNKKTVCIVEDNQGISELMTIIVTEQGYGVKTFFESDGVEAYAMKQKPALIIMDLGIPGQDGASLVKQLKKKKQTASVPIVLVSAKNSLAKIAKQCKADGYLAKPFNIKDLVTIVKKFA